MVGGETLIGREIRDLLAGTEMADRLRLIAADQTASGIVSDLKSDPLLITALNAAALEDAGAIVLAGAAETSRTALDLKPSAPLIDLTYASEEHPLARLRSPLVEPHDFRVPPDAVQVIAHPASIAIALLLSRVHREYAVSQSVIHVFEPASERGAAGVDELQKQTVSLLSFQPLPKTVFDSQLSFTMLARLGEEARVRLDEIETRVERHLATLLAMQAAPPPMPSLRLVQAPVFHGHSFSVWLEFEEDAPSIELLEDLFAQEPFDLRDAASDPPNNVGIAGQSGVSIGAIAPDTNRSNAVWLWMACDNLRLAAENAIGVLREVL